MPPTRRGLCPQLQSVSEARESGISPTGTEAPLCAFLAHACPIPTTYPIATVPVLEPKLSHSTPICWSMDTKRLLSGLLSSRLKARC